MPVGVGQFQRLRPLQKVPVEARGWTLDVLNIVRKLGKREFNLRDVYAFAEELGQLHPRNRHVEPKIRQQLQVLRDGGVLLFLGRGRYRVVL